MTPIRLMLVDDQEIVRAGLPSLLERVPDIEVVGESSEGERAVKLAAELQPDVVLMDVSLPDINGAEATRRIKAAMPMFQIKAIRRNRNRYFFASASSRIHAGVLNSHEKEHL